MSKLQVHHKISKYRQNLFTNTISEDYLNYEIVSPAELYQISLFSHLLLASNKNWLIQSANEVLS